jgi:hypothetical protein
MQVVRKFALSAVLLGSIASTAKAQTHYLFPAEANNQQYGRVIDIVEVEPSVVALQTFQLGSDYSFKQVDLSLYNLALNKQSEKITISNFDSYRGGFGVMSNKSLVINFLNTSDKYELKNFEYLKSSFSLDAKASVEGSFVGVPGGITSLKGGGYVMLAALMNKETNVFCNQVFRKNSGTTFGMDGVKSDRYEHSILMKPHFLQGMHNFSTPIKNPSLMAIGQQIAANEEGKSISLVVHMDDSDAKPYKVTGFDGELKEEWNLEFEDLRFGFKPIAYGKGNNWFLTTFQTAADGISTTTSIQKYTGKSKLEVATKIENFEANGSMILANGDLCVYGFKSTAAREILPMFIVFNPLNLQVKKSWTLSAEDQPCKEISEIAGQTIVLPGKLYAATQLSDGSVVFGGHMISNVIVLDGETNRNLTFNYMLSMPAAYFK